MGCPHALFAHLAPCSWIQLHLLQKLRTCSFLRAGSESQYRVKRASLEGTPEVGIQTGYKS